MVDTVVKVCYDVQNVVNIGDELKSEYLEGKEDETMLVEERYQKILGLMKDTGSIRGAELQKKLHVSLETMRRDLENMGTQGLIRRARGGAFLEEEAEQDNSHNRYTPFGPRGQEYPDSKNETTEFAVTFVKDGQSIALDPGTTAFVLVRALKNRFRDLTVVTNSMVIANELTDARGITLIVTGGMYRPEEPAFVSDIAGLTSSKLNIDAFFLTTCGISVECGVMYQRMDEVLVQEKMMESSDQTVAIAGSSELRVNPLVKMCDVDRISRTTTDPSASAKQIEPFVRAGVPAEKPQQGEEL